MRELAQVSAMFVVALAALFAPTSGAQADEETPPLRPSARRGAGGFRAKLSAPLTESPATESPATESPATEAPAEALEELEPPQMPLRFGSRRARAMEALGDDGEAPNSELGDVQDPSMDEDDRSIDKSSAYGESVLRSKPNIAPPAELELLTDEPDSPTARENEAAIDGPIEEESPAEGFSRLSAPFEVQPAAGQVEAAPAESESVSEQLPPPTAGAASGRPGAAAAALLERWLKAPSQRALAGKSILLNEAILTAGGDRARQLVIVKNYWTASCQIAEYHLALTESQTCRALAEPEASRDRAAWQAARAVADARAAEAELAAVEAQQDLALACGLSLDQPAPLPADPPFVGNYATKLEALFQGRPAPENVRRIDRALPLAQRVIDARAAAALALDAALAEHVEAYEAGQATIGEVLAVSSDLRASRDALLGIVKSYNHTIADYALYVAAPGLDHSLVVKMLIVEKTQPSVLKRSVEPSSSASSALASERATPPAARTGRLERPLPSASEPPSSAASAAPQATLTPTPAGSPPRPASAAGQFVPRR